MTKDIRKKIIRMAGVYVLVISALIGLMVHLIYLKTVEEGKDALTTVISLNEGIIPDVDLYEVIDLPEKYKEVLDEETKKDIDYFTVWVDEKGEITNVYAEPGLIVSEDKVLRAVKTAMDSKDEYGYIENYRYKNNFKEDGNMIVFVKSEVPEWVEGGHLLIMLISVIICLVATAGLVILMTIKIVKPMAESQEKHKQYVTEINHELKTPLTVMMSNLEIVEEEKGKSEWIDDIRSEGERMSLLINQLLMISKMEEGSIKFPMEEFDFSGVVRDTVSEFSALAKKRNLHISTDIKSGVIYKGNEELIRRLVSIFMDNAVKYCDENGEINIKLYFKRNVVITAENTYKNVDNTDMEKLFERFYCADKTKLNKESHGIGLSVAKAIAKSHKGDVYAYKKGSDRICFKAVLK